MQSHSCSAGQEGDPDLDAQAEARPRREPLAGRRNKSRFVVWEGRSDGSGRRTDRLCADCKVVKPGDSVRLVCCQGQIQFGGIFKHSDNFVFCRYTLCHKSTTNHCGLVLLRPGLAMRVTLGFFPEGFLALLPAHNPCLEFHIFSDSQEGSMKKLSLVWGKMEKQRTMWQVFHRKNLSYVTMHSFF